jgi:DNA-binding MarR family transcriptional regulator
MIFKESEKAELKKSTAELKDALKDLCAFANSGEGTGRGTLNGTLAGTLNEVLQTLYSEIKKQPGIQAKDLSDGLSRPVDTVKKQIKKLVDLKLIERRGSRKTGGYWKVMGEG